MKVVVGIPARMGASRFPGKPLCDILGMPMIEHVYRRCLLAKNIDSIFIACCDKILKDTVEKFGAQALMTHPDISRPGLRVAEACKQLNLADDDIVVVVQGDEPLVHPDMINLAVEPLLKDPHIQLGTLVAEANENEWLDSNEVKVLVDKFDNILFMTRSPVPSNTRSQIGPRLKQVAIMPFRKKFLVDFESMEMMPYEKVESIELLRAVEHGIKVRAIHSSFQSVSVDTEPDRLEAENAMRSDPFYPSYSGKQTREKINKVKETLKSGGRVFGTWSMLSSPAVLNVIATTGLDFVIVDLEHGPTSFETAENQLYAAESGGIEPIIRLAEDHAPHILHALEIGAQSILVSQVSTASQAERIVKSCKYFPDGDRGLSPFTRNHGYSDQNLPQKLQYANEQMLVGILVEGVEGVSNIPEIAKVPGLDMIYLGVYDLSQSCGVPGDLTNTKVLRIMRDYVKLIEDCGLAAGSVARDPKYIELLLDAGFRFVSYRVDCAILRDGLESAVGWYQELSKKRC
ncbi:HpcH/HpaI aldolase/citrate lyase-Cytidylyltransferase family protein [Raphidiopsis brookii D9]|nr:HpcH/HpaI aldolase/citrate lyase-Cytidylyltransferase family protein [Raphidiopsis brookii D9]